MRSHVVFKLLNYVTDKIVRLALTTYAYVNVCANCLWGRESRRDRVCAFRIIKRNFMAKTGIWSVVFIPLFTIFICLASVVVGFGSFAVLGCKDLWNKVNHLAKWYGHVMRCLDLRSPCVSLKIIAHLRTFVSQSDSSIQRPRSIKKTKGL